MAAVPLWAVEAAQESTVTEASAQDLEPLEREPVPGLVAARIAVAVSVAVKP